MSELEFVMLGMQRLCAVRCALVGEMLHLCVLIDPICNISAKGVLMRTYYLCDVKCVVPLPEVGLADSK